MGGRSLCLGSNTNVVAEGQWCVLGLWAAFRRAYGNEWAVRGMAPCSITMISGLRGALNSSGSGSPPIIPTSARDMSTEPHGAARGVTAAPSVLSGVPTPGPPAQGGGGLCTYSWARISVLLVHLLCSGGKHF